MVLYAIFEAWWPWIGEILNVYGKVIVLITVLVFLIVQAKNYRLDLKKYDIKDVPQKKIDGCEKYLKPANIIIPILYFIVTLSINVVSIMRLAAYVGNIAYYNGIWYKIIACVLKSIALYVCIRLIRYIVKARTVINHITKKEISIMRRPMQDTFVPAKSPVKQNIDTSGFVLHEDDGEFESLSGDNRNNTSQSTPEPNEIVGTSVNKIFEAEEAKKQSTVETVEKDAFAQTDVLSESYDFSKDINTNF